MRATVPALLAAALLAAAAPPARAAAPSTAIGGCGLTALYPTFDDGTVTGVGVVDVEAVLVPGDPSGPPVSATVTCEVFVDGESRPGPYPSAATFSGTGVVAGVAQVSFVAARTDLVWFCETVDFTSDDTPTEHECWWVPPTNDLWCDYPPGSLPPPGWCWFLPWR